MLAHNFGLKNNLISILLGFSTGGDTKVCFTLVQFCVTTPERKGLCSNGSGYHNWTTFENLYHKALRYTIT